MASIGEVHHAISQQKITLADIPADLESFRTIYALDDQGKEAKICEVDIRSTLETMANLELLVGQ